MGVFRDSKGNIIKLTKGTDTKGWNHILKNHLDHFARKGITKEELPKVINKVLKEGRITKEARNTRGELTIVYEHVVKGVRIRVIVNPETGEVISAYPIRVKKI